MYQKNQAQYGRQQNYQQKGQRNQSVDDFEDEDFNDVDEHGDVNRLSKFPDKRH
jgi:hypothetical protein